MVKSVTATALAEEIGDRLKQARLNRNLTQSEVAELAGIARKTVLNAEKGKVQLDIMIAILMALDLTQQIDLFLPKQEISPLQLAKLQGKKRQRASGQRHNKDGKHQNGNGSHYNKYRDDVVGAVSFNTEKGLGSFEYDPGFKKKARYLKYRAFLFGLRGYTMR